VEARDLRASPMVLMTACQTSTAEMFPPTKHLSCHDIITDVIRTSQHASAQNPMNWAIANIDTVTSSSGPSQFECNGVASLSSGERMKIRFAMTDTHGQQAPIYTFDPE
jgi:hypothetical protein